MRDDLRAIGPNRYATTVVTPWGQRVAAEVIITTRQGWGRWPEAEDARWAAYRVGPAVIAIRLLGEIPTRRPRRAVAWAVPVEWN
ncbi:MAG: hypothetical protein IRY99_22635 [Isosphaeraceae bacterium]|nr:hypothetical protein [Isosphaeraceae bacterium]